MNKKTFTEVLLNSELIRNTSILISGTALAQLIPILLQPVLRRLYFTPEVFGAYSVYLSIIGILLVISSFRYEQAIILPKKDTEALNIFFLTVILNFAFNAVLLIVILIWKTKLSYYLNLPEAYSGYLYLVPLGTFLFNTHQSINFWLVRKKRFFAISLNKFIRRGFEGISQVTLKMWTSSYGLIYGDIIGHFGNIISGFYQGSKSGMSVRLFSLNKIKYVLYKYSEYPKFNIVPSFMSACSYLLPAIMINKFFSAENTGYFDLAKLFLSIPLALIATSLSNVLLQRISEKKLAKLSIRSDLLYILLFVGIAMIFEVGIILVWAEDIFRIFFGATWEFSGTISRILVWAFAFNFIVSSFSSIYISLQRIKLLSIWQVTYFIAVLSLYYFSDSSFTVFLKAYVSIELICCLLSTVFLIYIVVKYERSLKFAENG